MDLSQGRAEDRSLSQDPSAGPRARAALDNGQPLTENTAILPYLGKRYKLWPTDPIAEAQALSTIGFFAATVHPAHAHISRPERYATDTSHFPNIQAQGKKSFHEYLTQIDGMLAGREWLSDQYSVLDPYAFTFYTWGVRREVPMAEMKNFTRPQGPHARPARRAARRGGREDQGVSGATLSQRRDCPIRPKARPGRTGGTTGACDQVALTRRVLDFVERDTTELAEAVFLNPTSTYTCPEQAEREQQVLFRGHPLFFGLSCELPKPGDWRADDLSGVPVLVVRGGRRPAQRLPQRLPAPRGQGGERLRLGQAQLRVPLSRLDLRPRGPADAAAPGVGFPGLSCAERSLVKIPVAEKHGMIWVQATPGADIDVDALLGGLGPEMASYRLDSYSHYQTRTLAKDMNWKLVIDTFLETWHVATLHRDTVGPIFQPNVNAFDAFGRNGRLIIPRRTLLENARASPRAAGTCSTHSAIVYTLFPNALLVWQGDHFETWRSFPVAARPTNASRRPRCSRPSPPSPTRRSATGTAIWTC